MSTSCIETIGLFCRFLGYAFFLNTSHLVCFIIHKLIEITVVSLIIVLVVSQGNVVIKSETSVVYVPWFALLTLFEYEFTVDPHPPENLLSLCICSFQSSPIQLILVSVFILYFPCAFGKDYCLSWLQ